MKSLRVITPAKINLFLRVLSRRPYGYHNIETIFQAIGLFDELEISIGLSKNSLEVPGHPDLETSENLVLKALACLEKRLKSKFPVSLKLIKRIPVAAGLGGGSSDAAAALIGVVMLYDLKIDRWELVSIASELGADVPFFLTGGTAIGTGVGDMITPLALPFDYKVLVANQGFPVSTKLVFSEHSKFLTEPTANGKLKNCVEEAVDIYQLLHNDLQDTVERLYPNVLQLRRSLERCGVYKPLMSGSGPTVFGVGQEEHLLQSADCIRKNCKALCVPTYSGGPTID
jgi:4-diphosphocytidyl-2-C-methyl-D-erythritol kinase